MTRRDLLAGFGAVVLGGAVSGTAAACGSTRDALTAPSRRGPVAVAGPDTDEGRVLAEIYARALRSRGRAAYAVGSDGRSTAGAVTAVGDGDLGIYADRVAALARALDPSAPRTRSGLAAALPSDVDASDPAEGAHDIVAVYRRADLGEQERLALGVVAGELQTADLERMTAAVRGGAEPAAVVGAWGGV